MGANSCSFKGAVDGGSTFRSKMDPRRAIQKGEKLIRSVMGEIWVEMQ